MPTKQSKPDPLQARRRRLRSAALWQQLRASVPGMPPRLRFRYSRWRNGTEPSPTENLEELISALTPVESWMLIGYLIDVHEEHHGEPTADVLTAFMEEAEADGAEDVIQFRAAVEPAARQRWMELSLRQEAKARAARVAMRREMSGTGRKVA